MLHSGHLQWQVSSTYTLLAKQAPTLYHTQLCQSVRRQRSLRCGCIHNCIADDIGIRCTIACKLSTDQHFNIHSHASSTGECARIGPCRSAVHARIASLGLTNSPVYECARPCGAGCKELPRNIFACASSHVVQIARNAQKARC